MNSWRMGIQILPVRVGKSIMLAHPFIRGGSVTRRGGEGGSCNDHFGGADRVSGKRAGDASHFVSNLCDQNSRQATSSSVVQASFLQHASMLSIDGSNVGEHVWVEENSVCGGE